MLITYVYLLLLANILDQNLNTTVLSYKTMYCQQSNHYLKTINLTFEICNFHQYRSNKFLTISSIYSYSQIDGRTDRQSIER